MNVLKKFSTGLLVAANLALVSVVIAPSSAQASDGGDFCNEYSLDPPTACGCITGSPWLPDGCYEHNGTGFDCIFGSMC